MKIKPTIDREATKEELERIKKTEKMLAEEQKLPPISQMVRNLAVDHWKSLKAFMKGENIITSQAVAEKRWSICLKCPHLLFDETNPDTNKKDGRCTHCGCFMNVKVHYSTAECPIDKWSKCDKCDK
tara:strand:- start:2112 stop:2492 length:381 start_codon:yes stop_codon:yes gene_type:complete